jgi:hypothetical protein
MGLPGTTLASARRAFFVGVLLCTSLTAGPAPMSRPGVPLKQIGKLDPAEAGKALEQLRHLGIAGNYFFEFQLRVMPRRGEERLLNGKLWGGQNNIGALTRVSLTLPGAQPGTSTERRLLIQNGPKSAVWRCDAGGQVEMLGVSALFEPLVPNTELTAFDLQMPYIYWEKFTYEGLERFRGRPAYVVLLQPPMDIAVKYPALTGVRVHLDTQFSTPMQTQLIGASGEVLKTMGVTDLKKIGDQWIPKTTDVRDNVTRNKTRMNITAAGLGLDFSRTLFEPANLTEDIRPPHAAELTRIDP